LKGKTVLLVLGSMLCVLLLGLIPGNPLFRANWALVSFLFLGLVILAFFYGYELQRPSVKEISLIATMAALAAVSRVPFVIIPGLQPMTFLVMITGWVFGVRQGFAVGAIAALASNFFLGQGPWTPWQMFGWGIGGALAALAGRKTQKFEIYKFTFLVTFWGYAFGWIMNIWHWIGFIYPLNKETFIAAYAASFTFDTIHAFGNLLFALTFGKTFYEILQRYKKKITISAIDP